MKELAEVWCPQEPKTKFNSKEYYKKYQKSYYQRRNVKERIIRKRYPFIKIFEERNKDINYCQACGFKQVNGFRLDIHHLDNNEENNAVENLVRLCPTCHIYLIHRCHLTFEQARELRLGVKLK
jgi:hypothetical protein